MKRWRKWMAAFLIVIMTITILPLSGTAMPAADTEKVTATDTPETTLEVTGDKDIPKTTPEVTGDKDIPETTPEVTVGKDTPETTPEVTVDKDTPETTPEVTGDKDIPETTPEVTGDKKTPDTTPKDTQGMDTELNKSESVSIQKTNHPNDLIEASKPEEPIFQDNFDGGLSAWKLIQGTGSITDGKLSIGNAAKFQASPAGDNLFLKGDAVYEYSAGCKNQWLGFQFQMADIGVNNWDKTGYLFYIRANGKADLLRADGNGKTALAQNVQVENYQSESMVKVRIEYTADSGNIKIYFNGQENPAIDVTDTKWQGGYFGLACMGAATGVVDYVKVWGKQDPSLDEAAFDKVLKSLIVYEPLRSENKVSLPKVPEGYEVTYRSSSPQGYLDEAGTKLLKRPAAGEPDDTLSMTYQVTWTEKNLSKDVTLQVPISAEYTVPDMTQSEIDAAKSKYSRQKYGLFVHYVPRLTKDTNGIAVNDVDVLADSFNAREFAREVHEMGYEYVIFTSMHYNAVTLYPSEVNKRWRDDRRSEKGWKSYSDRDVIEELYEALAEYGIDLHLYAHPVDGHDFTEEDKELTGWNDCGGDADGDHETWNQFQNELYDEMCKRYQGKIKGFWFDGMYEHTRVHGEPFIDLDRFNETLRAYDPGLVVVSNSSLGNEYDPNHTWANTDFWSWELNHIPNGDNNPFNPTILEDQAAALVVGSWWTGPKDQNLRYTQEQMFRYLVGQAAASRSGGFAVATGVYPGAESEQTNGNLFAGDFYENMKEVYQKYIKNVEETIKDTNAGKAYKMPRRGPLDSKGWGVSTESADSKYVYLHLLYKPSDQTFILPDTDDGSVLGGDAVRLHFDGSTSKVKFVPIQDGYEVTLADQEEWDELDTIIRVERLTDGAPAKEIRTETVPTAMNSETTGKWQRTPSYPGYYTTENEASLTFNFEGSFIEWYGVTGLDHGAGEVYIDGELQETVDMTRERQEDVKLFRWDAENGQSSRQSGSHTIKIVSKLDASRKYLEITKFVYGTKKTTYTITYEGTDGAVNKNSDYYVPGSAYQLVPIHQEGKNFEGWYDSSTGGNQVTEIAADAVGDIRVYARWKSQTEPPREKVAGVSASPAPGTYAESQKVTLATKTAGAQIYYTTDGKMPDGYSKKYVSGIEVHESMTIRAIALKDDMEDSDVAAFSYTIVKDQPQPPVIKADKSALENLIHANKDKKQGDYTEDSWNAWDAALADAKAVLEKEDASQAEVDQARQNLEKAAAGLKGRTQDNKNTQNENSDSNHSSGQSGKQSNAVGAKTGDDNPLMLWILILVCTVAAGSGAAIWKFRKNRSKIR